MSCLLWYIESQELHGDYCLLYNTGIILYALYIHAYMAAHVMFHAHARMNGHEWAHGTTVQTYAIRWGGAPEKAPHFSRSPANSEESRSPANLTHNKSHKQAVFHS